MLYISFSLYIFMLGTISSTFFLHNLW